MGVWDDFEDATGIEVPDVIEGIHLGIPNLSDLANSAEALADKVGDVVENIGDGIEHAGELVEKCSHVGDVVAKGRSGAKECFKSFLNVRTALNGLDDRMEPLRPLFDCGLESITEGLVTKDNIDAAAALVLEFLNVGNMLKKVSHMVSMVGEAFETIKEIMGPLIDKVREFMPDIVKELFEALKGVGDVLSPLKKGNGSGKTRAFSLAPDKGGVLGKCEGITGEFTDIYDALQPIAEAWAAANWSDAASFGFNNSTEIQAALQLVVPTWRNCKVIFMGAKAAADGMFQFVKHMWDELFDFIDKICSKVGISLPDVVTKWHQEIEAAEDDPEDDDPDDEGLQLDDYKPTECPVC